MPTATGMACATTHPPRVARGPRIPWAGATTCTSSLRRVTAAYTGPVAWRRVGVHGRITCRRWYRGSSDRGRGVEQAELAGLRPEWARSADELTA
jgi:hypothetical protein